MRIMIKIVILIFFYSVNLNLNAQTIERLPGSNKDNKNSLNEIKNKIDYQTDGCDLPDFEIYGDHFILENHTLIYKISPYDPTVSYLWSLTNDNTTHARIISFDLTGPYVMVYAGPVAGGRFWLSVTGTNNCGTLGDQGSVYVIREGLPSNLKTFSSANDNSKVTLSWQTESELNNAGFDVERKSEFNSSEEWQKIGFVKGQGTTDLPVDYSFVDSKITPGKYMYRLKQTDKNGSNVYFELDNAVTLGIPEKFSLSQNYPNPFNPTTKIDFDLSSSGMVRLTVFDNVGREVKTIVNEFRSAGHYSEVFNASSLSSGAYFYRIETGAIIMTMKMMLLK